MIEIIISSFILVLLMVSFFSYEKLKDRHKVPFHNRLKNSINFK